MRRGGNNTTTGGDLPGWADRHGSCDSAAIDGVGGLFSDASVAPGGVHDGVEPVVQGCSRGPESSVVWFVIQRGVGGTHFSSGFPDPSSPHVGDSDVDGGCSGVPDLSREGPFDVHQDRLHSDASPRLLDGMQGCQLRMTSYDEEHSGPNFTPAYGGPAS